MGAQNVEGYAHTLEGRLRALAVAHDHSLDITKSGLIKTLIESEANLYRDSAGSDKVSLKGEALSLDQRAYSVLSLVVHEMMTNAAKYGALSTSNGRLDISWHLEANGECRIVWQESQGPVVVQPTNTGFGTKLIRSSFEYDLPGKVHIEHKSDGLYATFQIPAAYVGSEELMMIREAPLYISEKPQLKGTSILVVEDQSLIAMDVEDTLREMGAQDIRLVSDAEEAMAALSTFKLHIAILDFNLGSITLETVAEYLSERGIPFIFMTGYSDQSSIPERFRHIEVIRKPIDISSLIIKLNSMINAQI